jgi:hypothetical protein
MQYRRAKEKGGTYFFTMNLADRKSRLLQDGIIGPNLGIAETFKGDNYDERI